jgi:hypothetical protein
VRRFTPAASDEDVHARRRHGVSTGARHERLIDARLVRAELLRLRGAPLHAQGGPPRLSARTAVGSAPAAEEA